MLQWNSCRQKPDVLSSIQGLRKLVEADYVCICFVTKHHYTELPWFSFSLFYILLFSVHIVNVNAAQSSTVFYNFSVNIYIYICFTVHSADSGTFFQFFYSIMVKRKKLWEHIFFYSCLEWRANYLWL